MNKLRAVIAKYTEDLLNYGKKMVSGCSKKVSLRTRLRIIKISGGKNIMANNSKHILILNMHKFTITRILAKEG